MKYKRMTWKSILAICISACAIPALSAQVTGSTEGANDVVPDFVHTNPGFQNVNMPFILNQGQCDSSVMFYVPTFAGSAFVTKRGIIVYSLSEAASGSTANRLALREELFGATVECVTGKDQATARINRFHGRDRQLWSNNVLTYNVVDLGEVYDGISVQLEANGGTVEKVFHLYPGARPRQIRVSLSGAQELSVNEAGELEVDTALGKVKFSRPVAYQKTHDRIEYVDVAYTVNGYEYGFMVGDYDAERPLVIDPMLASTFLGGADLDGHYEVPLALAGDGTVYVASRTGSLDFPATAGAYGEDHNGGGDDVFIARLSGDLTTLLAATFLGGSDAEGVWPGVALALNSSGEVFVAGVTYSSDFPTTPGAYEENYHRGADIFISRLSGDLSAITASTFLGGIRNEGYVQMALDDAGDVYVTGATASSDFPTTPGVYDEDFNPGGVQGNDTFVAKLDGNLTTLLACTFLGSSGDDYPERIVIAQDGGSVYLTGWTMSQTFPTSPGAYRETYSGGSYDAFVSRLSSDLTTLPASTLIGGALWDFGYDMTLDGDGNVYVTGHTASPNYPTTAGSYDETYNGVGSQGVDDDTFVSKLSGDLTTLIASTFLGDLGWENGTAVRASQDGYVYVAGSTSSSEFPVTDGAYDVEFGGGTTRGEDVFITRLDADLTTVYASTFLGGAGEDTVGSLAMDDSGGVYVAGATNSTDFPTSGNAYDDDYNGPPEWDWAGDVYVAKLDDLLSEDLDIPAVSAWGLAALAILMLATGTIAVARQRSSAT